MANILDVFNFFHQIPNVLHRFNFNKKHDVDICFIVAAFRLHASQNAAYRRCGSLIGQSSSSYMLKCLHTRCGRSLCWEHSKPVVLVSRESESKSADVTPTGWNKRDDNYYNFLNVIYESASTRCVHIYKFLLVVVVAVLLADARRWNIYIT